MQVSKVYICQFTGVLWVVHWCFVGSFAGINFIAYFEKHYNVSLQLPHTMSKSCAQENFSPLYVSSIKKHFINETYRGKKSNSFCKNSNIKLHLGEPNWLLDKGKNSLNQMFDILPELYPQFLLENPNYS